MPGQPKRLAGQQKRAVSAKDFPELVRQFTVEKAAAEAMTKRVNDLKVALTEFVKDHGEPDDKGSLFVDVEGVEGVGSMKLERRVSNNLDKAKAEAWLKKNGLWDDFKEIVEVLDVDALAAAAYEGETISERRYKSFFVETEGWALRTIK